MQEEKLNEIKPISCTIAIPVRVLFHSKRTQNLNFKLTQSITLFKLIVAFREHENNFGPYII